MSYTVYVEYDDDSVEQVEYPWLWMARLHLWFEKLRMRRDLRPGHTIEETNYDTM